MSWNGIQVNDILLFTEEWKSREEIAKKFELSAIESWHCVRWLGKLRHDVIVEKRVGLTGRKYMYKTRRFVITDIESGKKEAAEISKAKIEELSEASEVDFLDGDETKESSAESNELTMEKLEEAKEAVEAAEHEDTVKDGIEEEKEVKIEASDSDPGITPPELEEKTEQLIEKIEPESAPEEKAEDFGF